MQNRKQKEKKKETMESIDNHDLSFRKIMKDVELFSSSHMTWKERKAMENNKVVTLGGKPPKKQRLPLSVARVQMKKQKEREQKMLEQSTILDRFGGNFGANTKKPVERRRPEQRVLKATEGNFRNGVLDVRHLLHSSGPSRDTSRSSDLSNHGKKNNKGGSKKKKGQKKGGKRKSR
ncbi:PREDICTED: uncharacterized protein LOC104816943 [Tarenaya hassleriana]|uniref:uncharacterized protein LOC104816943 n=1 Tax=Tarenaya hassleriana TaxID=28532 RepID=UPI00053C8A57|nr:PREDICTED: uncharacterized protein LOC104816943 [Tarenaya hassleriana]